MSLAVLSPAMTLNRSAEDGDVEALYSILADDPSLLDQFGESRIVHNPLHIAARVGNTHYAMEIATLKLSLAKQLNRQGLSPMHVALENEHKPVVRGLLAIDRELVRVKGKGRITPLHYVAQMEDLDLLAEFLSACPSSIEDLTVHCETAVHVAVKNKRLAAVRLLKGWLLRVNKEEVLEWKDEDGNTVLHTAASTNQPKVMELLIGHVNVNDKNLGGRTAMNIFKGQGYSREIEILGESASQHDDSATTSVSHLGQPLSLLEKLNKILGISSQDPKQSSRDVLLLVATLIVTSTFQAVLNPPLEIWQADTGLKTIKNTKNFGMNTTEMMNMSRPIDLYTFFFLNTIAFFTSFSIMVTAIIDLPFFYILYPSAMFLSFTYYGSLTNTILYSRMKPTNLALRYVFVNFFGLCLLIANLLPLVAFKQLATEKARVRRQLSNLKRHLRRLINTNDTNENAC